MVPQPTTPQKTNPNSLSRATALLLLGMLAVAAAQGPPTDAAEEKIDAAPDGSVVGPDGSVLLPPTSTEGTIKFVHSMVATQADMISEMVDKVREFEWGLGRGEREKERKKVDSFFQPPLAFFFFFFSSNLFPSPPPHHRSTPACTARSWA